MSMRITFRRIPWLAIALLATTLTALSACGSDPVAPTGNVGEVSFDWVGYTYGHYSARGAAPDSGAPEKEYAQGLFNAGAATVAGVVPKGEGAFDVTLMTLNGVTPGAFIVICGLGSPDPNCPQILVIFDLHADHRTFTNGYVLTDGEVRITQLTATRLRGTFRGTAVYYDGSQVLPFYDRKITVTNGHFDVPLR